ncbi:hypothetical protein FKM82_024829 [Ascaphus truei]
MAGSFVLSMLNYLPFLTIPGLRDIVQKLYFTNTMMLKLATISKTCNKSQPFWFRPVYQVSTSFHYMLHVHRNTFSLLPRPANCNSPM